MYVVLWTWYRSMNTFRSLQFYKQDLLCKAYTIALLCWLNQWQHQTENGNKCLKQWYMKMFSGSCNVNLFSSRHDIINANIAPLFHFSKENSCILSYLIWKVACIDDLNWNLPVLDNSMYLSHIKNNTLII